MPTQNCIDTLYPIEVQAGGTGLSTIALHGILLGNGTGNVAPTVEPTNGQLLIGSTGNFPVLASLSAGAGISITNAAGAITIANTGAGANWNFIAASQPMVVDNGYVCNGGAALVLSLPAVSAQGAELDIFLDGSASFQITQAANQQILYGNTQTTLGVGGSITSTSQGDSIRLLCVTANLRWVVLAGVGNPTIV